MCQRKNGQLIESQQAVIALYVLRCEQVVSNLLTKCDKLEENIRLVTIFFQSCWNNLVITFL